MSISSSTNNGLSRRKFAGSAAVLAMPAIIPASALGKEGRPPPSERIIAGCIGFGNRATADLKRMMQEPSIQFVAGCDVKRDRRDLFKQTVNQHHGNTDCVVYRDHRKFLAERTDIEVLLVATGDRWHAPMAIAAMRAGKDLYCEKPGSMSVAEGRAVADTAAAHSRIFQTGAQRLSEPKFIFPTEMARQGKLGEIKTLRAHLWPRVTDVTANQWLPAEPEPDREELDWDAWLGAAPWRPYSTGYLKGCSKWGVFWDLGAGVAGWGSHTFVQCQMAIGAETTSPVDYIFPGNKSGNGMTVRFANGVAMVLQFEGWRGTCGVTFEGTEGTVSVADGYSAADVSSPSIARETKRMMAEYTARTQRPLDHMSDFLTCVRSRRQPIANAEVMHRSMTTNHCINICLKLERDLKWNPAKEQFVNDAEANRYLSRAMRAPWII